MKWLKGLLPIITILLVWYWVTEVQIWNEYLLPKPERVFSAFVTMLKSGELMKHVLVSSGRVWLGFSISFASAFCLGMLAGLRPSASPYYNHVIEFMRSVPPLSLIALLILWFGIGETSKIIIIVLASFFPVFTSIKKGFLSCDSKLLEVGDSLGFTPLQKFYRITIPYAIPDILVGMRVGLGYSWRAIIGAEMVAAASGLGYLIWDAQQMSRSDKVIVGILVIGIVGYLFDKLFSYTIRRVAHGGVDNSWS